MKKNNKTQKLILGTQTLRNLSKQTLISAVGGQAATSWYQNSGDPEACVGKSTTPDCG